MNKSLYNDAYSKSQQSDNLLLLGGPFFVKERIGKNAVRSYLLDHFKIPPVVNLIHAIPFVEQISETGQIIQPKPEPLARVERTEYIMDNILNH